MPGRVAQAALLGLVLIGPPPPLAQAAEMAERIAVCLACHGEGGRSENANVPSLGGQPSSYVLNQLYMFREKLRIAEPMNAVAAELSDTDLQDMADFVAALPPPAAATDGDPARLASARAIVDKHRCGSCHNVDLSGHDHIPRLGGQREDYLRGALAGYKAGTRAGYDPAMAEVVKPMSDEELAAAAYYLARLR